MAQQGNQLDREKLCCSICLDLLKDSVTIPCGHSYCKSCIEDHWDSEEVRGIYSYSCPQCREAFTPRPELKRNIVLADLVEELKKTGLQAAPADHCAAPADHCAASTDHCAAPADHFAAPADHCAAPADHCSAPADHHYAGPEDVACDLCTGKKVKALKSCLVCLVSYCENHLQPHFDVAPLKKHKLVEPCEKLQENICPRHDEVMKMFCRTDQQCICYLCSVDDHQGHNIVSAAAERTEKQKELEETRLKIQQRVQDTEGQVKWLQQDAEAIKASADGAVDHSDKILTELINYLKQQIRSQQETEEHRVKELQEKLEQEIAELKRRDAELEQLAHTQDHKRFLQDYTSLPTLAPSTHTSGSRTRPLRLFEDLTAAVSQVRGQIQVILTETSTNISQAVAPVGVLLKQPDPEPEPEASTNISQAVADVYVLLEQPEPKTRGGFLKYSEKITMDPNTVNKCLILSGENRKVRYVTEEQSYSKHPERFTGRSQVLSRESLTGRCYWEVKMKGRGVYLGVSYKTIRRSGNSDKCVFGFNDRSWSLDFDENSCDFHHNNFTIPVFHPVSSRVGVYLDHTEGVLAFYSVSDTMTLIHRVETTFTRPLHAGVYIYNSDCSVEFCKLK